MASLISQFPQKTADTASIIQPAVRDGNATCACPALLDRASMQVINDEDVLVSCSQAVFRGRALRAETGFCHTLLAGAVFFLAASEAVGSVFNFTIGGTNMCQVCDTKNAALAYKNGKRDFLKRVSGFGLGLAGLGTSMAFAAETPAPPKADNVLSPEQALQRLLAGNQRYRSGNSRPFDFMKDRAALVSAQNPYASIVSCADARVVPELCFDEQRGDLFVTRVAGNYLAPDVLASLEYGALVLKVPLILVLGHQNCGAVIAAIAAAEKNKQYPGHIQTVTSSIAAAVRAVARKKGKPGDKVNNVIRENVRINVKRLVQAAPVIKKLVAEKKVMVVGGVYNLETGMVDLLK